MNLSTMNRIAFTREATPGRLFFWNGTGPLSWINSSYQQRMRGGDGADRHWDHVGVIGEQQGSYESTLIEGPSRNRSLRRYLDYDGRLMIGEVEVGGGPLTEDEVKDGLGKLILIIQRVHDTPFGLLTYDWLSLVSLGHMQMSNRLICSELVARYMDEAARHRRGWSLHDDRLILPDDLLRWVRPVWDSRGS